MRWLQRKYPRRKWGWLRYHILGQGTLWPTGTMTMRYNPAAVSTTRYRNASRASP